ncbi:MAG TPA: AAA family ATPase [Kofleriaceae bacterium]|nr:AAA family ATPase [Kofleriaceae bacterium]
MLREDTVVSALPEFTEEERTRARGPRPFIESRTDAAIASIGGAVPPVPKGWGAAPRLKVVAEPARRGAPPTPPPTPRALANAQQVMRIPEPCFEPSVVESMPLAPPRAPVPQQPARQIAPLGAQPGEQLAAGAQGKVIVLFGCRGGAGTTTLAVNTAGAIARSGKSVCIIDLDLQLGDVFVALDLTPETSLSALAREASTIDASALKRRLARHDSGIYALTQTGHPGDVDPQLAERLPALMSALADHFDYVIVDGVRDFGDYALAALDMADQVALVLAQDVASVRRAARAVTLFRRLGYSEVKLRLVLNRATRRARIGEPEIMRALGLRVAARVRNDFKRAASALDDGALIGDVARGSGLADDVVALATTLRAGADPNGAVAPAARAGLFGRLFGGKGAR